LQTLLADLATAYARIHEAGVLQGDVRASNILVDECQRVRVIDFGLSAITDSNDRPLTRSYDFSTLEPEAAPGFLRGQTPAYTAAAEQYALGALTYRLATGQPMRQLPADQETALRRLAEGEPPRPFTQADTDSWPSLEALIAKAVATDPEQRFSSVSAFAKALRSVRCPPPSSGTSRGPGSRLVEQTLAALTATDAVEEIIPSHASNLHDGAAGAAWFLYRAALLRDDGTLLCHADRWARVAERGLSSAGNTLIARAWSPLHDGQGVSIVHALIALARDDDRTLQGIVQQLSNGRAPGTAKTELFLGQAGRVAALAMLQRALNAYDRHDLAAALEAPRTSLRLPLPASQASLVPIEKEHGDNIHLGMAHGWAGICYAQLQSAATAGEPVDASLRHYLGELAKLGDVSQKDALRTNARQGDAGWSAWPGTVTATDLAPARSGQTTPAFVPGWCSGSAGFVYLWAAAEQTTDDSQYRELAERAGTHAWRHPDRHGNLCCGLAGRAFALSRLFRLTGDQRWLDRARTLAAGAALATSDMDGTGLFRGPWGPALINLELEQPTDSRFPLLEW
jgi:serine/threonine-protein kinase